MLIPSLTLIGKPGCHLCDEAREAVARVVGELEADGVAVSVVERSILDDADLDVRWHDDIPVVLIGTALHDRWHVDADRLRLDLLAAAGLGDEGGS
ncbi:glutaredoxin family protein [uncultured Amnibacterium sp.]|uniref:glutaredoxin family protein n=1 Tax=uncultured Amnibacterium sp. TaxID=1631851 RepID=UPI0035CB65F5